ncbi:EamA family transporter [Streptomyces sp. AM 4-1-1]|uniref:EamA family transporter n=1 Tax=Streptomyces sp. AM 4-1-1 TaxID=3028710 RepID=UPI0023B8AB65|nr:EamA family transporter [Streptomyces sp. AM 4-1-1]WEH33914.1 EamA family transporter [Streptomyces sp. AM 4-1-1]
MFGHGIKDHLLSFTLISTGGAVVGLAAAAFVPFPAAGAWPYLGCPAVLHGSSLGYIAWLMILEGLTIPVYALYRRRGRLLTELRPFAVRGLAGGAMSVVAYGLVLWAQTRAPLAPIAALRESSIIVGAVIGTVFFKERFGAPRLAAAGLMVIGIGLMLHTD